MKVLANRTFFGIDVLLVDRMIDGEIRSVVDSMTAKTVEPGTFDPIPPTITGQSGIAFLKSALQAAWDQGLRPEGCKDGTAETNARAAAVDNHLQDMRRMVFGETVVIPPFIKPTGREP